MCHVFLEIDHAGEIQKAGGWASTISILKLPFPGKII